MPTEDAEQLFVIAAFPEAQIGSTYSVLNLGTFYLISILTFIWAAILLIAKKFNIRWEWLKKKQQKWYDDMFCGALLRLALEAGLSVALAAIYNVYIIMSVGFENMETELPFFWLNLVSLGVMLMVTVIAPIFFLSFYLPNYHNWEDEHFEPKWGAIFDGLKKDKKSSLIYPVFFLIRRTIFVISAVYLKQFFLFQLATQFFSIWF